MYKPKDTQTPPLFPELFPLGGALNGQNRWLRLAAAVPWDRLEEIYARQFTDTGRPAKDARLVCGLLIVGRLEGCGDETAIALFNESPYIQAFCGFEHFVTTDSVLGAGLLARARKNQGAELEAVFTEAVLGTPQRVAALKTDFKYPHGRRTLPQKIADTLHAAAAAVKRAFGRK